MTEQDGGELLTLEPLIDAVRDGVEAAGWSLSGLQKTTSHQFEGRWEGDSTRSAYLFFHSEKVEIDASIDVYLDETSRGLTGNVALVVDLLDLGALGDAARALSALSLLSVDAIDDRLRRPVTLRLRLDDAAAGAEAADTEVRFKVRIERATIAAGAPAVRALAQSSVASFERILASPGLAALIQPE